MNETEEVIKGVKSLLESKLFKKTNRTKRLELQVKYYKMITALMLNTYQMHEQCKEDTKCQKCLVGFIVETLFSYIKCIEILQNVDTLVTLTEEDRNGFLNVFESAKRDEELDVLIEQLEKVKSTGKKKD